MIPCKNIFGAIKIRMCQVLTWRLLKFEKSLWEAILEFPVSTHWQTMERLGLEKNIPGGILGTDMTYKTYNRRKEVFIDWDSRSSEKMAAKFMKRDTFIKMVFFKQIFHFCIFRRNFNCHTSPTSMPNFCIGFWNDIGDKKSEKNHFQVLPISRENYPCKPVFEGFELNQNTSPPFLNE